MNLCAFAGIGLCTHIQKSNDITHLPPKRSELKLLFHGFSHLLEAVREISTACMAVFLLRQHFGQRCLKERSVSLLCLLLCLLECFSYHL